MLTVNILLLFFYFFFHCPAPHRHLHSFPTRRSSDLALGDRHVVRPVELQPGGGGHLLVQPVVLLIAEERLVRRSEEHTSELQSRGHLVCRLLLEKKKYTT